MTTVFAPDVNFEKRSLQILNSLVPFEIILHFCMRRHNKGTNHNLQNCFCI